MAITSVTSQRGQGLTDDKEPLVSAPSPGNWLTCCELWGLHCLPLSFSSSAALWGSQGREGSGEGGGALCPAVLSRDGFRGHCRPLKVRKADEVLILALVSSYSFMVGQSKKTLRGSPGWSSQTPFFQFVPLITAIYNDLFHCLYV